LSVAIITQQGKPLVARQFSNVSKAQITNHLAVFPKLLTKSSQSYVESSTSRYVYQEIDQLYFVLITTKDSNILEDLELLAMLVDLTREIIQNIEEKNVVRNALQLILAYDECVFDGYRQNVSINDVITFLQMESKEEDEYNAEMARKIMNAQSLIDAKSKELDKKKKELKKSGFVSGTSVGFTPSATTTTSTGSYTFSQEELNALPETEKTETVKPKRVLRPTPKGMVLGKKSTTRVKAQQMIMEEGLTPAQKTIREEKEEEAPAAPIITKGLLISLKETITVSITRTGGVEEFAIKGSLIAMGPQKGVFNIKMKQKNDKVKYRPSGGNRASEFKKTKTLRFDNSTPASEPTSLLQWMYNSKESNDLPIIINCWGDPGSGKGTIFSLTVELKDTSLTFEQVVLSIPCKKPREAEISDVSGEIEPSEREEIIRWIIPELSAKESSVDLEFALPTKVDESEFYPIDVTFTSDDILGFMDVEAVALCDEDEQPNWDEPAQCQFERTLVTDKFLVQ
jgi:FtsZ-binding cell division protein ZapB